MFSIGKLNDEAYATHQVCLEVQDKVASMTAPGVVCGGFNLHFAFAGGIIAGENL